MEKHGSQVWFARQGANQTEGVVSSDEDDAQPGGFYIVRRPGRVGS